MSLAVSSGSAVASHAGAANADGVWTPIAMPGATVDQVAIYDPLGDRMIVFGGISETKAAGSNLTWAWSRSTSPAWTLLDAIDASDPISGLIDATALLDPVRARVLVFGGTDGTLRNDVWTLALVPVAKWSRLLPQGTPPSAREGSVLVYDSARDRMILFGGNGGGWNTDVWALSLGATPAWTPLATLGSPPPAVRSAAVYDAAEDRMVIYNGSSTWQLSFAADANQPSWTPLTATGTPPFRANFTAVDDSAGQRMIVYGGSNGAGSTFGETWALSLSASPAWSQLLPTGTLPKPRYFHSAAMDPTRGQMIVFGGFNLESGVLTWRAGPWVLALEGAPAWQEGHGDLSPPRSDGADAAIYDSRRDRLFVGGTHPASPAPSWISHRTLDLGRANGWDDSPGVVDDRGSAIYDPRFDGVVVFGGKDAILGTPKGGPIATPFGTQPAWSGTSGPSPGTSATRKAIYDPLRYRIVLFGGNADSAGHGVWAIGLGAPHLAERILPQGSPPPDRVPEVVVYDPVRDRMVVFGGSTVPAGTTFNDTWSLNLSGAATWTEVPATGAPPSGGHYAGVYDPVRDRLVVTSPAGAWALPLAGAPNWTALSPAGTAPDPATAEVAAVYDPVRDRMLLQLTPNAPVLPAQPYTATWALEWGQPARPGVACAPGDSGHIANLTLSASFDVANVLGGPRAIGWKFETDRAWPGLPLYGTAVVDGNATQTITVHAPVPDSSASGNSTLTFTAWYAGGEGLDSACAQTLEIDATTATLPSFESMLAEPGLVTLRWDLVGDARLGATIYRRDDAAALWRPLGSASIESNRYAVYRDAEVEPGAIYWYRAGIPHPSGEVLLAPVRVEVPATLALALEPPSPNPARELRVTFVLPDSRLATLDVFDVGGRRVAHVALAGPGGRQQLAIRSARLPSGLYLIRLRHGERTVTTRVTLRE